MDGDIAKLLSDRVRASNMTGIPLCIRGGGSKDFYGYPVTGCESLDMADHAGVMQYEPAELILRARAGTRLSDIHRLLHASGQRLPFEPPDFSGKATLGGAIAAGLSGPGRPWSGPARDYVLGVTLLTGEGEIVEFGGQVMKNVAGYDVSRLLAGSMGTLGVILDISLKVLPAPACETTRVLEVTPDEMATTVGELNRRFPVSGASWHRGLLHIRISGSDSAVALAARGIGGEEGDAGYWEEMNRLTCFQEQHSLWRISVPPGSPVFLDRAERMDWGGGLRWLVDPDFNPAQCMRGEDGHATLMRYRDPAILEEVDIFQRPSGPLLAIHRRLKQLFDPGGILNPGRMYRDF